MVKRLYRQCEKKGHSRLQTTLHCNPSTRGDTALTVFQKSVTLGTNTDSHDTEQSFIVRAQPPLYFSSHPLMSVRGDPPGHLQLQVQAGARLPSGGLESGQLQQLPRWAFAGSTWSGDFRSAFPAQASFPSQPSSLPGPAAIVRDGSVVCDRDHFQTPHGQSFDGRLEGSETGEWYGLQNDEDPASSDRAPGGREAHGLTATFQPRLPLPCDLPSENRLDSHTPAALFLSQDPPTHPQCLVLVKSERCYLLAPLVSEYP